MIPRPGSWTGGGFGPVRLDRAGLESRLADVAAVWVLDELIDAFEPAFARFRRLVEDRKRKAGGSESARKRRRRGPEPSEEIA